MRLSVRLNEDGLDRSSAQPQATWKEPVLRINN
nr:MAG TPA: hypothetical protein [Caudoviricetes sp.]